MVSWNCTVIDGFLELDNYYLDGRTDKRTVQLNG